MSDPNTKSAVFPYTVRDNGRVQVETCRKGRSKQVTILWLTKVSYWARLETDGHIFIHGRTAVWFAIHGVVYLELNVSVESYFQSLLSHVQRHVTFVPYRQGLWKTIALGKAVSSQILTAEERVRFRVSLHGISGCRSDTDRFFSQYFSFPLSVSFHHCSIFIRYRRYVTLAVDSVVK